MSPKELRTIDFGTTSALRSQTVWHAVAHGVSDGQPATLSFVRPADPYVCIGYHRRLDELDLIECKKRGLPIYRRMVGGGPVYLDSGQLFFQITVPMSDVPAARPKAIRQLLEPAVEAFQACGIDAHIDDRLEIVVGDRKICGYGAGQIGDAAIVVGNLIEAFDHEAATAIVKTPTSTASEGLAEMMSRYVCATPTDSELFKRSAIEHYATSLGLAPRKGELTTGETERLDELDKEFLDPDWIKGPERPTPAAWQVKVRAGVFIFSAENNDTSLTLGVDDYRVVRAEIQDADLNGQAAALSGSLIGLKLSEAETLLEKSGAPGQRVKNLLSLAEPKRL